MKRPTAFAERLLDDTLAERLQKFPFVDGITGQVRHSEGGVTRPGSLPMPTLLVAELTAQVPGHPQVTEMFRVAVSHDAEDRRPLWLLRGDGIDLRARVDEITPRATHAFRMRLAAWIDEALQQMQTRMSGQLGV